MHLVDDNGQARASGRLVPGLRGGPINRMTRFEPGMLPAFGLPAAIAAAR
jgi:hypothetical protein